MRLRRSVAGTSSEGACYGVLLESSVRNRLLLVAAALLFSTGGAAIKAATLTGWQVASFRSGVAALVLLAVVPEARRRWQWRMLPVAVAYAATLILFVLANRLTTSANAIFLQSTAPLYLLLLGPLVLHEPIRRAGLLYALAVGGGLILFFAGSDAVAATAPDPPRGNLLALASGVTYALMLAGLRWQARGGGESSGVATVTAGNLIAFWRRLPMAVPVHTFSAARRGCDSLPRRRPNRPGLLVPDAGAFATCPHLKPPPRCSWNRP